MENQIMNMSTKLTQQLAEQETRHQRELDHLAEQEMRHQRELTHLNERLNVLFAQQSIRPQETTQTPSEWGASHESENSPEPLKPNHLSEKIPDPPAFTGKQKDLPAFLSKLQAKLEANSDQFPTSCAWFLYAYSLLDEDMATIIHPMFDKDVASLTQLTGFLEATYRDPNRKATAQAKLSTPKQRNKAFAAHFSKFCRLTTNSKLNEAGLIMQLKNSLSDELQQSMVGVHVLNSLMNTHIWF